MINIDDKTRRLSQATIVVGYKQENKAESIEFKIPEYLKEYGKKICFKTKDGKVFSKLFDNTTSNIFTFTRTETQYGELDATIQFFKTQNEDMIVYKTSMLHIIFNETINCEDEVQPDEPKIPILESLIEKVTDLNNTITENEETRNNNENTRISNENERKTNEKERETYYTNIQNKVNNGEFNGATYLPNVDAEGNISWTNNKGLENPSSQNIRGPQGVQGPQGEAFKIKKTYPSVEAMQADFNNMEVGDFVMIATSIELEDNAKLYARTETEWVFITDLSGAQGIQGPQGIQGIQGIQGKRGIGISKLEVKQGYLYITLTDNATQNAGLIITDEVKQWLVNEITNNAQSNFNTYYNGKVTDFNNYATTKIQEYDTNAQNKITEYDEHAGELTNRITTLENEKTELQLECKRLREDNQAIAIIGQASGENITLNDSSDARFKKFVIGGNSWQETREGYNLANLDKETYTISGVTVTNNGDGSFTLNGETTSSLDIILTKNSQMDKSIYEFKEETYLLKTIVESGSFSNDNNLTIQTSLLGKNGDNYDYGIMKNILSASVFATTKALTANYKLSRIEIYVGGAGVVFNNYKIKVLLAKSSDKNLAWEPYGAMPSPGYKSDIQNVTGSVNVKITNNLESTDENYKEQSFTFPLQEGQRLMKGDYLADDGIHHKRKQIDFDGTENWTFGNIKENTVNLLLNDFQGYNVTGTDSINAMCNYFVGIRQGASLDKECFWFNGSGGFRIRINKDKLADTSTNDKCVESFKIYLAEQYANGTPVIVEYDLAEEEIESYTEKQQTVHDEIKKTAHSYGEQTHIFSLDEISPIFNIEYLKDTQAYIDNQITTLCNSSSSSDTIET